MEQLLAQQLGGEEALVAVGELVGRIGGRTFGQRLPQCLQQRGDVLSGLRADRHDGREVPALRQALQEGNEVGMALHQVDLVDRRDDRLRGGNAFQDRAVLGREAARLDHEQRHVGVARGLAGAAVQPAVQDASGARLLARGVDEHVLATVPREDAGYQMPGGLRPGRDDRQLLPDQPVEQAGLADVGAARDRDDTGFQDGRSHVSGSSSAAE